VADEREALQPLLGTEALERLDLALPRAGPVGRRVAEPRQVGRDGVQAAGRERVERGLPHQRGLGVAVDEQHRGIRGVAGRSGRERGHLH
jgi:hypothetical protein